MSAVKQSHEQEPRFYFNQQKTVDLTQQERQALSLVWTDNSDTAEVKSNRRDTDTAHCAVLGYN
ncbi:hypothetical protein M2404_002081 [Rheinheimera pacifica]|uniref:hypothetical protein n=1 Tax=Rheinheimera pacifica TaxID=173990 RepID=UPI0021694AAA|nr:hypothetical protein [Rheinheimera pacifica]MCS4307741.1 hypothetical protein [Rheinheimera pacifica]